MRRQMIFALVALLGCKGAERAPAAADSASSTAAVVTTETSSQTRSPDCGAPTIGEERVGRVRVGDPVDSLRNCEIVRDTIVPADEGTNARKIFIAFAHDTIAAEIVLGRVWRIEVLSPGPATPDSLGVGTPLGRLLRLNSPRGLTGEGRLFVVSPDHCGLSFQLSTADPTSHRGEWNRAALAALPESTVVRRVLVIGCPLAPPRAKRGN